ncbi:MAG: sigma-70 family RNA polymerase sigma factor [Cyanobacteria bacterium P01_E01_bin.6]
MENDLLTEYSINPSRSLRSRIASENERLVCKAAHEYVDRCELEFDDLYQIGMIGLLKAIDRFDSDKGVRFSSFAMPWIRGEIRMHLRNQGIAGIKTSRRAIAYSAKVNRIKAKLESRGRQVDSATVAQWVRLNNQQWASIQEEVAHKRVNSLESVSLGDSHHGHDSDGGSELHDVVKHQLARLPSSHRKPIIMSFYQGKSTTAIASALKKTPSEVQRLISDSLQMLKSSMEEAHGSGY